MVELDRVGTGTTASLGSPPAAHIVSIHTDGSCLGNPGRGGYAAIMITEDGELVVSGGEPFTTNQRMELMAAIRVLEELEPGRACIIHSDSQYLTRGMTEWLPNWKAREWRTATRKTPDNLDLWQRLDALAAEKDVKWVWVKGHARDKLNVRVDALAKAAAEAMGETAG